jgi:hypothetical protein
MLKKLTNKNREQKKQCFEERIAKGCYNICIAYCDQEGVVVDQSMNFATRDAIG